jgi:DNA invertase Pin-like site-specific DNA recombinase
MMMTQIQSSHRERGAYVYVRQSTPLQVHHHQESTERQYHLRERALALGWSPTQIEVIDEDQGRSGTSATHRSGFQRLVSAVSLGQVGMVLMLEASRLARNNSDWYRLIEICGVSRTLIADESAVYDPRDPNDRLLLGVKGTLSEAELFTLRTRLYEGRWNKAKKGVLRFPLPVGYVHGPTGQWELDPDTQVRERLGYVFAAFRRYGVARAVVRDLRSQGFALPVRLATKEGYGSVVWKAPTLSAVIRLLTNPAYTGAYVFGRWDYSGDRRSAKTGKVLPRLHALAHWPVCLPDHHPGYLSWEEFVQNREQLRHNWNRDGSRGVVREGAALLQGIVACGVCGRRMGVQHHAAREKRSATYLCALGYQDGEAHLCQSMTARPVDAAVTQAFLEAVSPLQLAVAVRVLDQVEQTLAGQRRQWELQLQQTRYEARLAQRQYEAVDPEHRLVASELERRWNEALERVAHLEKSYAQAVEAAHWSLTAEEQAAIQTVSQDLPALWQAPTTTNQDRKQLLRFALEAVYLDGRTRPGYITVQLHWRSGAVTAVRVRRPVPGEGSLKTPAGAVALIREFAPQAMYAEIAERVNAAGWRTAFGRPFTPHHVGYICRREGLGRGLTLSAAQASHKSHPRRMSSVKTQASRTRGVL